jgi:hypothetical protein
MSRVLVNTLNLLCRLVLFLNAASRLRRIARQSSGARQDIARLERKPGAASGVGNVDRHDDVDMKDLITVKERVRACKNCSKL